jgi:hypothetical protein
VLRESNRRFDIAMLTRFVFGFVLDKTRLREPATEESPSINEGDSSPLEKRQRLAKHAPGKNDHP